MTGWKSWDLQSIHFLSLAKHTWSLSAYLWHCSIWQRILHHAVLKQKEHVKTQVGIFERSLEEESFCFVTQPSPENISVKCVQRTYNSLCSLNALAFIHKFKCRFLDCRSDYVQLLKSCVLEYKTAQFKQYSCVTVVFPTGLHLSFFPSSLCHVDVCGWSSGGQTAVLGEGDAASMQLSALGSGDSALPQCMELHVVVGDSPSVAGPSQQSGSGTNFVPFSACVNKCLLCFTWDRVILLMFRSLCLFRKCANNT